MYIVDGAEALTRVSCVGNESYERTYSDNSRIVMNTSELSWLVYCQVFHFRCTEDDVLVGLLNWRNKIGWWPEKNRTVKELTNAEDR